MDTVGWILLVVAVVAVLAVAWAFRGLFERITIYEFERGLRYRKGKFDGVLEPGQYWLSRQTTTVTRIDTRSRFISVPGQEVLSSDSVSVKVSLAAEFSVEDPAKAIHDVEDYHDAL